MKLKMKTYIIVSLMSASAMLAVIAAGCKDSVTATDLDAREIPASNVSFSKHIQPVLEVKCNFSGCHDNASRAGGLSLTSWSNTTSSLNVVFPGEPQNSTLYTSLVAGAINRMPPEGPSFLPMTKKQIDGVYTWIKEGAKNN